MFFVNKIFYSGLRNKTFYWWLRSLKIFSFSLECHNQRFNSFFGFGILNLNIYFCTPCLETSVVFKLKGIFSNH